MEIFSHLTSEKYMPTDWLGVVFFCQNVVNYSNRRIAARPVKSQAAR